MKKLITLSLAALPLLSQAQDVAFVKLKNGNLLENPGAFYHNGKHLMISKGNSQFSAVNEIYLLKDGEAKSLDLPWSKACSFVNPDYYMDGILSSANLYAVVDEEIYFVYDRYDNNNEQSLYKLNTSNEKFTKLYSASSLTNEVNVEGNTLYLSRGEGAHVNTDTLSIAFNTNSNEISSVLDQELSLDVSGSVYFQGNLVAPIRDTKTNSYSGYHMGVYLYNTKTKDKYSLLPQAMMDSLENNHYGNSRAYNFKVLDNKIFFVLCYRTEDYHEFAIYSSEGKANDAKRVAIIKQELHEDRAGMTLPLGNVVIPQDYFWNDGFLYFVGQESLELNNRFKLWRSDLNGTVQMLSDKNVIPQPGQKNSTFQRKGNHLYFAGNEGNNPPSEFSCKLYRLDMSTLNEEALYPDQNIFAQIKLVNDSLMFLISQGETWGQYDYYLANINNGEITHFDTESKHYNNTLSASAWVNGILYYTGSQDGISFLKRYNPSGTATGIKEEKELSWSIYPNPAQDVLFVETSNKELSLRILDINGRVMLEQVQVPANGIDVSSLKTGLYLVGLYKGEEQIAIKKVVIQ